MSRTRRTRNRAPLRPELALPPELVVEVLEYLSAQELWTAARVSRQFYAAVWRAGLVINRRIVCFFDTHTIVGDDAFRELVAHALPKDLRIGLTLACLDQDGSELPDADSYYKIVRPQLYDVFGTITAALQLIASLSVKLPDYFLPGLLGALGRPAPSLRFFGIFRATQDTACSTPLPVDLFGLSAPQLRVLTLRTMTLPGEPITAFRSVSSVELEYGEVFPRIEMGRHFPLLTGLRLLFFTDTGAASPKRFDLSGLALRSIVIGDGDSTGLVDAVERSIDLSAVPVVRVISGQPINWIAPVWKRDNGDLSIRLSAAPEDAGDVCVTLVPGHLQWRHRYYLILEDINNPVPIADLPNFSARLTYVRIDALFLRFFVARGLTLTALRDLHVDLRNNGVDLHAFAPSGYAAEAALTSFPAAPPYRAAAPCPALEEITLFALNAPIAGVESRRVAFLARALGQLTRPRGHKAALALVGVTFARPVARALLNQTISKIRTYAFAGLGSGEDYDDGLWEDGL